MSINNQLMLFGATTPGRKNQSDQLLDHLTVSGKSVLQCTTLTASQGMSAPDIDGVRFRCQTAVLGDLKVSGTLVAPLAEICDIQCPADFNLVAQGNINMSENGNFTVACGGNMDLSTSGAASTLSINTATDVQNAIHLHIRNPGGGVPVFSTAGQLNIQNSYNDSFQSIEIKSDQGGVQVYGETQVLLEGTDVLVEGGTNAPDSGFRLDKGTRFFSVRSDLPADRPIATIVSGLWAANLGVSSNMCGTIEIITNPGAAGNEIEIEYGIPYPAGTPVVMISTVGDPATTPPIRLSGTTGTGFTLEAIGAMPVGTLIQYFVCMNA